MDKEPSLKELAEAINAFSRRMEIKAGLSKLQPVTLPDGTKVLRINRPSPYRNAAIPDPASENKRPPFDPLDPSRRA